jgi:hypothetical protein
MTDERTFDSEKRIACHRTGRLINKSGCFALHDREGGDIWLELDPIPMNLMDQDVEVKGRWFGQDYILVDAIGPVRSLS